MNADERGLKEEAANRPLPDLAIALAQRSESVLERWSVLASEALPKADALAMSRLRDSLARMMTGIAQALASPSSLAGDLALPAVTLTTADTSKSPSESRGDASAGPPLSPEYPIEMALVGYSLLRRALFEETSAHLGRPLSALEIASLNGAVDHALRRDVVDFSAQQGRQLQAALDRQGKYLSFLSHDLRGGLNAIFLMIEVLRRELSGRAEFSETVQDLETMRRSILETVGTLDRFLLADRFRKGKVAVNPAPISLKSMLGEIGAQFASRAQDKGLHLKVEVPDGSELFSDRELLSMILQSFAINAVKYSRRGTVRIAAKPLADSGGWVLEVADEGPGIEPQKLRALLDGPCQGDANQPSGAGLGLSLVRQAAGLLGVRLRAESELGRGSTFFVEVPEPTAAAPGPLNIS